MQRIEREKSTNQLAVWQDLIQALEQVDTAWQATKPAGSGAASSQLPGNVAVALVKASQQATAAIAGVTDTLVDQYDSGATFRDIATALRQARTKWPMT